MESRVSFRSSRDPPGKARVQRFGEHVTLVLCTWAVRKGAVQLWLRIYFASEDVLFNFGIERL
eukprot:533737-Heterocapsa_arctica.AAC.1